MNGSFIPVGVQADTALFLNPKQIMDKHNLSSDQYHLLEQKVMNTPVQDALWRWPDGACRDILIYLVVTSH